MTETKTPLRHAIEHVARMLLPSGAMARSFGLAEKPTPNGLELNLDGSFYGDFPEREISWQVIEPWATSIASTRERAEQQLWRLLCDRLADRLAASRERDTDAHIRWIRGELHDPAPP